MRDDYWLCDEAASVYREAFAVLSFECHSPIMACYHGTPVFYLRQPEDTIKGQMWHDIGISDWVFEIEEVSGSDIAARLMRLVDDPDAARGKLEAAMEIVRATQRANFAQIRKAIESPS